MRPQRLVCLALALVTSLAVAQRRREIKPGFNLFSREQDVQLGKEFSREIERQVTVVENQPQLSTYIAGLGSRLAKVSQAPDYPYTFKVVAEKGINAFALPGGPIYVHAETVASSDNEAQLAGVMAHEISHVALRHSTQQVTKAYGVQIGLALAGAALGSRSIMAQLAQLGLGFGANSLMLKYSRDAERDADIVGARMMAAAGFDPVEMARFFEKLEGKGGGGRGLQFLSDHPNPGNRVKYVEEEVRAMPRRSYSKGSSGFGEYRSSAAKIPPAERRPAAAAPAGGQTREYRGKGFRLTHPGDWQAFGSDGGSVTIAPRQGISQNNVSLGLIAGYFTPRSNDLSGATNELVEDLLSKNPGLQAARGQRRSIVLGGVRGESVVLAGNGELDTLVTAVRQEGLFYLVLISPEKEHNSLQAVFQQIQSSVRFE
jgi:Zn-dependent protease with chaperone function